MTDLSLETGLGATEARKIRKQDRERALRRFRDERRKNLMATPGVHDCIVVLDHLKPDFNIGKIFRTADAMSVHEIQLVGVEHFDPSPAMGSFRWVQARFHDSFQSSYTDLKTRDYTLFTLEPEGGELLPTVELPQKSAFILGHEQYGISFDRADYPGVRALTIPQFGKVQSMNVSIAAALILYEYVRQQRRFTANAHNSDPDNHPDNHPGNDDVPPLPTVS